MTHEELDTFRYRFVGIMNCTERIRNKRLVSLMEDMEACYNIPLLYDSTYANNNPEVMRLYRMVSYSRKF